MIETIDLLSVDYNTDNSGTTQASIHSRSTVFCEHKSVGMREVYKAMAINRNPEIVAVLSDYLDYNGEQFVEFSENVYKVLRTYREGHKLELTLERTRDLDGVV